MLVSTPGSSVGTAKLKCMKKEQHEEVILELLTKLSLNVRIRRKLGLISVINLFHNLFYSGLMPENDGIIDNLLFGLEHLFVETQLSNNTLECTTNQCLQLRAASNLLAYALYKRYEEQPEIINRLLVWKNISNDLREFSEVRNEWLGN